ncbi:MAG: hypothetical protein DMG96_41130 [Acidobacteria bacterium]|nr:MAG: hypothetical protein DMG96_41130 [Acidobacteriota bacterium]
MNSDIEKVMEIIEQRILNLQQIKSMLLAEFGVTAAPISSTAKLATTSNGNGNGNQNRKDQLAKFLIEHGPSSRGTINDKSGIPKGTIANLLNKPGFVRRDRKWYVDTSSATQEITH